MATGMLNRKRVLALATEDQAGVTPSGSMTDVANMKLAIAEAELDADVEFIEDDVLRNSITATADQPTFKLARLRCNHLFRGPESGTDAPAFAPLARASGCRQAVADVLRIGAVTSGPFRKGETVVGGTSSAIGLVLLDAYNGDTHVFIETLSGTWAVGGETITGQTTAATATTSAMGGAGSANVGHAWSPVSQCEFTISLASVTTAIAINSIIVGQTSGAIGLLTAAVGGSDTSMRYRLYKGNFQTGEDVYHIDGLGSGEVATHASNGETYYQMDSLSARLYKDGTAVSMRGARGNLTIDITIGGHMRFSWEMFGVYVDEIDIANPTGISQEGRTAPLAQQIGMGVGDNTIDNRSGEHTPDFISAIQLQTGSNINRLISSEAAGGVNQQLITDRSGRGTMNPAATLEADYAWVSQFVAGEPLRMQFQIGSAARNSMIIDVPGMVNQEWPDGDNNGIRTRQLQFTLTGGKIDNISGSPPAGSPEIDALGGDNELVLIYLHTIPPLS